MKERAVARPEVSYCPNVSRFRYALSLTFVLLTFQRKNNVPIIVNSNIEFALDSMNDNQRATITYQLAGFGLDQGHSPKRLLRFIFGSFFHSRPYLSETPGGIFQALSICLAFVRSKHQHYAVYIVPLIINYTPVS